MRGGTLLILGQGVECKGQLCPPCEGMPRFALSSCAPGLKGLLGASSKYLQWYYIHYLVYYIVHKK